jgi:hypothetical protein
MSKRRKLDLLLVWLVLTVVFSLALLLWSYSAMAAPYLVSDPALASDNVTSCILEGLPIACQLDALDAIRVDLATLQPGSYTVRAAFCAGMWGCSDWSNPFVFQKPSLSAPGRTRLSK